LRGDYNLNSEIDKQLDIMDEAINLMNAARAETYELTFGEALEILKISRLDNIANMLDSVNINIIEVANEIEHLR
jgi:hypothetical protein